MCIRDRYINGKKVATKFREKIYDLVHGPRVIQHWVRIGRFPEAASTMIDWSASERAMQDSTLEKRTWVMKQAAGLMGVNKWMHRWGDSDSAACPRCEDPCETTQHVLRCPQDGAREAWTESVGRLREWLRASGTHPEIAAAICGKLDEWKLGDGQDREYHLPGLGKALSEQELIG